jgi:hypothetical protein
MYPDIFYNQRPSSSCIYLLHFAKNLSEGFKVRFDPETATKLREIASEQGVGPTTLIRMWVLEHLRRTS